MRRRAQRVRGLGIVGDRGEGRKGDRLVVLASWGGWTYACYGWVHIPIQRLIESEPHTRIAGESRSRGAALRNPAFCLSLCSRPRIPTRIPPPRLPSSPSLLPSSLHVHGTASCFRRDAPRAFRVSDSVKVLWRDGGADGCPGGHKARERREHGQVKAPAVIGDDKNWELGVDVVGDAEKTGGGGRVCTARLRQR
jgi:hypothetical protein